MSRKKREEEEGIDKMENETIKKKTEQNGREKY